MVIATLLVSLSACSEDRSEPVPQRFTVTLTEIDVVKQGSSEPLTIDGLPAKGATVTLTWP